MGIPPETPCEHHICVGTTIRVWTWCGALPTKFVTYPRRPPRYLCEEHEREESEGFARTSLPIATSEGSRHIQAEKD